MKGIILAGGTGSRLYPLTKTINKHLLPIAGKPMAQWNIENLKDAGITEILIISGKDQCGSIIEQFGDGHEYGVDLTYKVQETAGGIAQALSLAKRFVGDDDMCVILGDNIFDFKLNDYIESFKTGATIFLKRVQDPQRYGVAEIVERNGNVEVIDIEEKPQNPKTDLAVTGIYCYDNTVFEKIATLVPSARGEYEITDVNNAYVKENKMFANILNDDAFWSDAGTMKSYAYVNDFMNSKMKE